MMKIEEGKSYRDENGAIWVALGRDSEVVAFPWRLVNAFGHIRLFSDNGNAPDHSPLVAEATKAQPITTGPVVVETVKRIVPGTYGIVDVVQAQGSRPGCSYIQIIGAYPAADLRAAAATLTEIADALDEEAR